MLVDSHCHLGDPAYDADRSATLERAEAAGVGHVVVIGESVAASERAIGLAERNGRLSATAGVHPHEARTWTDEVAASIHELLAAPEVVAVGETGLDYHYDHSPRPAQRAAFAAQLALGAAVGKPVVIHAREAETDVAAMLTEAPTDTVCVLHSFAGGDALLEAALARDAYVSFSGMVTFRNWDGDSWIAAVPDEHLLIETDGPYLSPVPHRGRRNEPAYVVAVAQRVALVRGVTPEALAAQTTANARRCFGARIAGTQEVTPS